MSLSHGCPQAAHKCSLVPLPDQPVGTAALVLAANFPECAKQDKPGRDPTTEHQSCIRPSETTVFCRGRVARFSKSDAGCLVKSELQINVHKKIYIFFTVSRS